MFSGLDADRAPILQSLLDAVFDGAYYVDAERRILAWNPGAFLLTGYSCEEVVQRCCSDNILMHVDDRGTELCTNGCPLEATLKDGQPRQASVFLRHKLGYRVPVSIRIVPIHGKNGEVTGAVEVFRTTGEADYWKLRMKELERLAFIDPVTGIPNRRFLDAQIEHQLQQLQSAGYSFAACMLDLDHFKAINDRYGHNAGDRILQTACHTLLNCMRAVDVLGRWGGDELLLLLPRTTQEQLSQTLERMRALVAETTATTDAGPITTTVSIGATVALPGDDKASLLRRVDSQLYVAKEQGRNCCRVG